MDNTIQNNLTESAQEALNQTTQEIKEWILERAITKNSHLGDIYEQRVTPLDILDAKDEILSRVVVYEKNRYRYTRHRRMAMMLTMAGFVYAIFGIVFYLVRNYSYDTATDFGLIMIAVGVTVAISSLFYFMLGTKEKPVLYENGRNEKSMIEYGIIERWKTIEQMGTILMLKRGISNNKANSINFIVDFLLEELRGQINADDIIKLLSTRNKILHKGISISRLDLLKMYDLADKIIDSLSKKLN